MKSRERIIRMEGTIANKNEINNKNIFLIYKRNENLKTFRRLLKISCHWMWGLLNGRPALAKFDGIVQYTKSKLQISEVLLHFLALSQFLHYSKVNFLKNTKSAVHMTATSRFIQTDSKLRVLTFQLRFQMWLQFLCH